MWLRFKGLPYIAIRTAGDDGPECGREMAEFARQQVQKHFPIFYGPAFVQSVQYKYDVRL
jgi:hypothetical protein